jgi:CheY-like chemotaxis protein
VGRVVLVVDDEPLVLEITASMLEDLGCEVVTAPSAKDALEKLSTHAHIEILITDVNMPERDGYQLADAFTQMRDRLMVIMLSGRQIDGRGYPIIRKPFL